MDQLRLIYSEILRGYSTCRINDKNVYLKHLNSLDNADIDVKYTYHYDYAVSKGVSTNEEKLVFLDEQDEWKKKDEEKIKNLNDTIKRSLLSRKKILLPSQRDILTKEIESREKELNTLELEKMEKLGVTAESVAQKNVNDYYIFYCLYKDQEFSQNLFTEEEYDDLTDDDLLEVINEYNRKFTLLTQDNIKKIALSSFFLNPFSICDDKPLQFYGRPVCDLTYFQIDLFIWGIRFKNIMKKQDEIPEGIMKDPDKLIEWSEAKDDTKKNAEKLDLYNEDRNVTLPGATKKDLEDLGLTDENSIDLGKEARKKGGNLSFQDIIALERKGGSFN